jgi:hypothetical protein
MQNPANAIWRVILLGGSASKGRKESAEVLKPRLSPPYQFWFQKVP